MTEPQWDDVAKAARSMQEATAEDGVIEFLVSEGWQRHPDDNDLFAHATKQSPPAWITLADAFAIEQRLSAEL